MATPKKPSTPTNANPSGESNFNPTLAESKFCAFMLKYLPANPDINWEEFANDMGLKNANVAKARCRQIRKKLGLQVNSPAAEKGETPEVLKPVNADSKVTKPRKKNPKPRKMKSVLEDAADIAYDGKGEMRLDPHDGEV
ncbi:hypothetical protein O1611_g599 [Lasiodiplodia mahajangana]|uniref:Uncharacterized protein n=1 Tax=Lasiodiplodia mahajangana TaxID=1108764 RepID=A0ACC2JZQ7_9PEZI|nr:hypothetical protein O1611_g599 [Lasiodiplodia mahajangana]